MKSYASLQRIFTISGADMCVKQNMGEIANHFLRQKYHLKCLVVGVTIRMDLYIGMGLIIILST